VFLPRGVPHAFVVTSLEPVTGLQLTSPGGFEGFIAEMGRLAGQGLPPPSRPDVQRLAASALRHGNEIVGPPLSLAKEVA
jgi:hypothetical protein